MEGGDPHMGTPGLIMPETSKVFQCHSCRAPEVRIAHRSPWHCRLDVLCVVFSLLLCTKC